MALALTPREADVLRMRWGLDGKGEMSLAEIGAQYGVQWQRVRHVQVKALRKLRALDHPLAGVWRELRAAHATAGGAGARASRGAKRK